MSGWF